MLKTSNVLHQKQVKNNVLFNSKSFQLNLIFTVILMLRKKFDSLSLVLLNHPKLLDKMPTSFCGLFYKYLNNNEQFTVDK